MAYSLAVKLGRASGMRTRYKSEVLYTLVVVMLWQPKLRHAKLSTKVGDVLKAHLLAYCEIQK